MDRPNWFPGHMKKTYDQLYEIKQQVDFVIEIVDARLPTTSSNQELIAFFDPIPIFSIAVKKDLIPTGLHQNHKTGFAINAKDQRDWKKTVQYLQTQTKRLQQMQPLLLGVVVGLPNVGKSTFINFLKRNKTLVVQNRPGVTKKIASFKINNHLFLFDTPGVFLKKISEPTTAYALALLNLVKREVLQARHVMVYFWDLVSNQKLTNLFCQLWNIVPTNDCEQACYQIAERKKWLVADNEMKEHFYWQIIDTTLQNEQFPLCLEASD